jgi:hypothetical protein
MHQNPVEVLLNISEAMKFKKEINSTCGIEMNMLDTKEDGLVLWVERKTLDTRSYKTLADYATQKELSLLLEAGNLIISTHPLPSRE